MANASTMTAIRIEEKAFGAPRYRKAYEPTETQEAAAAPDPRYRSRAEDTDDEPAYLDKDLRELTVNLDKFGEIIERIENLRIGRQNEDVDREDALAEPNSDRITDDSPKNAPNAFVPEADISVDDHADYDDKENDSSNGGSVRVSRRSSTTTTEEESTGDSEGEERATERSTKLIERGPIRPQFFSNRGEPYLAAPWPARLSPKNEATALDYETSAEEIFRDKEYSETLNLCLDQLEGDVEPADAAGQIGTKRTFVEYSSPKEDVVSAVPAILVDDAAEDSLLEILTRGGFQAAQVFSSDTASNSVSSPATKTWPDSPASCYNLVASSSDSRASSPARSPASATNLESPPMRANLIASPLGSPQIAATYRVPQGLSSSSSSNQSYCDTPSPSNYRAPLSTQLEKRLGEDLESLPIWYDGYETSGTIVDSAETIGPLDSRPLMDAIDSNELQLVEEVLRDLGAEKYPREETEEPQVVPKSRYSVVSDYGAERKFPDNSCLSFECALSSIESTVHRSTSFDAPSREYSSMGNEIARLTRLRPSEQVVRADVSSQPSVSVSTATVTNPTATDPLSTSAPVPAAPICFSTDDAFGVNHLAAELYELGSTNSDHKLVYRASSSLPAFDSSNVNDTLGFSPASTTPSSSSSSPSSCSSISTSSASARTSYTSCASYGATTAFEQQRTRWCDDPKATATLNVVPSSDLQIPEMVASFDSTSPQQRQRRYSDRTIMPWPSLNLPSVRASERLKEGLNPKDVERAMSSLLKRPIEELARPDEDGDTMLMCLMGNPEELSRKRAYLAPLVERLGNARGALSATNNRGEDALYLAAMNCARMPYVVGYLAAAMLQKGIDVNQRLYHTRGDTLIHSVAARGDSHGEILAELLALRTVQGNAVFDLSKRNYDGRTALHVAVESHDPIGRGLVSVATVRLLLENGADPKIRETRCGDTALHMAVGLSCDPALVKVLLSKVSPEVVNVTNYNQNTALHVAAAVPNSVSLERQREVCRLLVHAAGRSNMQNRQGKTPLALVAPDRKETIRRIFYKKSLS